MLVYKMYSTKVLRSINYCVCEELLLQGLLEIEFIWQPAVKDSLLPKYIFVLEFVSSQKSVKTQRMQIWGNGEVACEHSQRFLLYIPFGYNCH